MPSTNWDWRVFRALNGSYRFRLHSLASKPEQKKMHFPQCGRDSRANCCHRARAQRLGLFLGFVLFIISSPHRFNWFTYRLLKSEVIVGCRTRARVKGEPLKACNYILYFSVNKVADGMLHRDKTTNKVLLLLMAELRKKQ